MSEQNNISSLDQEKKEVEALLNQQAVAEFEIQINTVPENYFNTIDDRIILKGRKTSKGKLINLKKPFNLP